MKAGAGSGRAMNLPPRLEGPHAWLWRMIYHEAGAMVLRSKAPGDTNEAAEWLWRGIVGGWIWVRHDRTGIDWTEPDRWLQELVSAEATRHMATGDSRATADAGPGPESSTERGLEGDSQPDTEPSKRPRAERHSVIMGHIWRYLSSGWARIADEEDAILFWHPATREFIPFTPELEADYRRLFKSLRNLGTQVERRQAGAQPYTGRLRARGLPETRGAYTGQRVRRHGRPSGGMSDPGVR